MVLVVLARDAVYFDPAELYAFVAYGAQDVLNDLRMGIFDVEVHVVYLPGEAVLYLYQQQLRHQHHRRREYRALDIARAADKADYRGRPEPGCGRQALDALALCDDYCPRAYEAYTGNDLRAETRDVRIQVHRQEHVLARQCRHRRAEADQYMRAEARRAALVFALNAYEPSAQHGEDKAERDRESIHFTRKIENIKHALRLLRPLLWISRPRAWTVPPEARCAGSASAGGSTAVSLSARHDRSAACPAPPRISAPPRA